MAFDMLKTFVMWSVSQKFYFILQLNIKLSQEGLSLIKQNFDSKHIMAHR